MQQKNTEALRTAGLAGIAAGFSLIPINRETKRPFCKLLPKLYNELHTGEN